MSFFAAYFVLFPIRERVSGSKHLQYISGVKPFIFWSAGFITDFIQYFITSLTILLVLVLFQMEEFTTPLMQGNFLILFLSFGVCIILLVYVLSFLFAIPTSGFAVLAVLGIFTGPLIERFENYNVQYVKIEYCWISALLFVGVAPMFAVSIIQNHAFQLEDLANEVNKYALVFPNYALGMGIVQLSTNYQLAKSCSKEFNLEHLCLAFPDSICCNKRTKPFDMTNVHSKITMQKSIVA